MIGQSHFPVGRPTLPLTLGQSHDMGQFCPIRLTYLRCLMFVVSARLPPRSFWGNRASVASAQSVRPVPSFPKKFIG